MLDWHLGKSWCLVRREPLKHSAGCNAVVPITTYAMQIGQKTRQAQSFKRVFYKLRNTALAGHTRTRRTQARHNMRNCLLGQPTTLRLATMAPDSSTH